MRNGKLYSEAAASASGKMVESALFAFNSNVDLVLKTDEKQALALADKLNLSTLEECVKKGEGKEESVSTGKMALLMKERYDEMRIGGQAGNMANLAADMGIRSYIHSSVVCKNLTKHLRPAVMVSSPFCFQTADAIMSEGEVPVHFVVDFGKDRYIAVNDIYNTHMLINRNFKRCMEKEIKLVERAVISGFHLLDIPEPKGRIEEVKVLLKRWKNSNSKLKVHLELADFKRNDVLKSVLEILAPSCDSIGFNEVEIKQIMESLETKWRGEADAMQEILAICPSAVLHNKKYAVVGGEDANGAEERLALGHLLAAFRAKNGRGPKPEELKEIKAQPIETDESKKFGKGFCFVPALSLGEDASSLGLGDSFSVGYFCSR